MVQATQAIRVAAEAETHLEAPVALSSEASDSNMSMSLDMNSSRNASEEQELTELNELGMSHAVQEDLSR